MLIISPPFIHSNLVQDEKPFVSAKKVMKDLGEPYASGVELASFHTVSKGFLGELLGPFGWGGGRSGVQG